MFSWPPFSLLLLCSLASSQVLLAQSELRYADPRFPQELPAEVAVPSPGVFGLSASIRELNQRIVLAEQALSELPPLQVTFLNDTYGYHSDFLPALDEIPSKPRWVLEFDVWALVGDAGLVLVPSHDRRSNKPQGYAFPKRFRIYAVGEHPDSGEELLVDWTEQDFPDPGLRPVVFRFQDIPSDLRTLRLEVYAGHTIDGLDFFSLARVYPIAYDEIQYSISNKVPITHDEIQGSISIQASSGYEVLPYWSERYLSDSRFTIGLPIADISSREGAFRLPIDESDTEKEVALEIDLGARSVIGWVNMYPAMSPTDVSVPGYGFPGAIKELSIIDEAGGVARIYSNPNLLSPGDNLMRVPGYSMVGRTLRAVFEKFPTYQGQAVFSLGEIEVFKAGANMSIGKPVRVYLGDELLDVDTTALVDGEASGSEIIHLTDWFCLLASGKVLEDELAVLTSARAEFSERFKHVKQTLTFSMVTLLGVGIVALIVFLRLRQKQESWQLRKQLNSDLHDDIGSKVAAVSLAATTLERGVESDWAKEQCVAIRSIAHEMNQGLRDVLWMTDDQTDSVRQLIRRLADCARRSVETERLRLTTTPFSLVPEKNIHVRCKRDVLLFLREALHNAACHSEARQIEVEIIWRDKHLIIRVQDNGKGFVVPSIDQQGKNIGHHGLRTMRERCLRNGGHHRLESVIGEGTVVEMRVRV